MAQPNNNNGPDNFSVDTTTLIHLCRQHNLEIMKILHQYSKEDVTELIRTSERIGTILTKCTTDFGDLQGVQLPRTEKVYVNIIHYEKKIKQLLQKDSFIRFITQAKLRRKIDQLSNSICVDVENLEKDIKDYMIQWITLENEDEFAELLDEVDHQMDVPAPNGAPFTPPVVKKTTRSGSGIRISDHLRKVRDPETKEKMDNLISIVKESDRRHKLLQQIPNWKCKALTKPDEMVTILSGHNDWSEKSFGEHVCGRSVSSYPVFNGKREGDPICDMFVLSHYENRTIAAVADGCSWGEESKEAARKASRMYLQYMKRCQDLIQTTHDAANFILRAYFAGHQAIVQGRNEETLFLAGTTTMLAGIVLELETPQDGKPFVFVCCSIGDCKAYHYTPKHGRFDEITIGNRGGLDVRDPGGRLGPYLDEGKPDLRNLTLYCYPCEESDIIALVSDGVHDNLDPHTLGKSPSELGISAENDSWDNVNHDAVAERLQQFTESLITSIVGKPVTVQTVTNNLTQHGLDVTQKIRTFMETNIGQKVPVDYKNLPGKPDHTTCLSFKVGTRKAWTRAQSKGNVLEPEPKPRQPSVRNLATQGASSKEISIEFRELLKLDMDDKKRIESATSQQPDNTLPPTTITQAVDEPQRLIWDELFGKETYVIEWKDFIDGLNKRIPVTPEDEQQLATIIDYSRTGSVTRFKFQEFLKGFGPLENCVLNVKKVVAAEWFYGFLSATESKRFLEQQSLGTFLVRFSGSKPGSFVLDYVKDTQHVRSVRLTGHSDGGFAVLIEGGQTPKERVFKSLEELIETYRTMGVLSLPFSSTLPQKPWFFGDLTGEEAEQLLAGHPQGTFLIRFSNQPGCFAASFVGLQNTQPAILKGLITKTNHGFQVNNYGMVFPTLDDLVGHYQNQKIFTVPLQQE
mmetsp:Transcript_14999/g.20981  ORF Transcript_14999/g.20981 Transcript_14999/m.20981 type:complete len:915 (+) Transcript_14999:136-2880(+)